MVNLARASDQEVATLSKATGIEIERLLLGQVPKGTIARLRGELHERVVLQITEPAKNMATVVLCDDSGKFMRLCLREQILPNLIACNAPFECGGIEVTSVASIVRL